MKDRKVKLNGTVLAGQTLYNLQRTPDVILGDDAGYVRGDILDANAVLTKILELIGGAPEIFDTLKELADAVQSVEEWRNSLKGITTSHINHNGTAREDDTPSFSATATEAALNYVCFSMTNGSATRHCGADANLNLKGAKLPVVSTTKAGILTATLFNDIENMLSELNTKVHAMEVTNCDLTKFAATFTVPAPVSPATSVHTRFINNPTKLSSITVDGVEYTGNDIYQHYLIDDTLAAVHHVVYKLLDDATLDAACWASQSNMTEFIWALNDNLRRETDESFLASTAISELYIPDHIDTIKNGLAAGCTSLRKITIPNTIQSITTPVLDGADLDEIVFENADEARFELVTGCLIDKLAGPDLVIGTNNAVIPNGVRTIAMGAFRGRQKLSKITIPESVSYIVEGADNYNPFSAASMLSQITVNSNNMYYDSRNNCNAIIHKDRNELIVGCRNTVIPDTVTSIGYYAFSNYDGVLEIPSSVTQIKNYAFVNPTVTITELIMHSTQPPTLIKNNSAVWQMFNPASMPVIKVPLESLSAYTSADGWSEYAAYIEGYTE